MLQKLHSSRDDRRGRPSRYGDTSRVQNHRRRVRGVYAEKKTGLQSVQMRVSGVKRNWARIILPNTHTHTQVSTISILSIISYLAHYSNSWSVRRKWNTNTNTQYHRTKKTDVQVEHRFQLYSKAYSQHFTLIVLIIVLLSAAHKQHKSENSVKDESAVQLRESARESPYKYMIHFSTR